MDFNISSELVNNKYVYIINHGCHINNLGDYAFLIRLYLKEMDKYNIMKFLINEENVTYTDSLLLQKDVIDIYHKDVPDRFDTTSCKIARIVNSEFFLFLKFWEMNTRKNKIHFKVVTSSKEGRRFLLN